MTQSKGCRESVRNIYVKAKTGGYLSCARPQPRPPLSRGTTSRQRRSPGQEASPRRTPLHTETKQTTMPSDSRDGTAVSKLLNIPDGDRGENPERTLDEQVIQLHFIYKIQHTHFESAPLVRTKGTLRSEWLHFFPSSTLYWHWYRPTDASCTGTEKVTWWWIVAVLCVAMGSSSAPKYRKKMAPGYEGDPVHSRRHTSFCRWRTSVGVGNRSAGMQQQRQH